LPGETESGGAFAIDADMTPISDALKNLERLSQSFGTQLTGALRSAVVSGRDLEDILRRIGVNLAGMALSQGLEPLQSLIGASASNLFGSLRSVIPFASGGVVSTPSYFPMGDGGVGLMGEAGAEAILPLRRGADGRLGVAAGGGAPVNVVFNVTAQDAASFRKSEAQITGMLARAVSRGARTL
jgi:phage-related minor tail protein